MIFSKTKRTILSFGIIGCFVITGCGTKVDTNLQHQTNLLNLGHISVDRDQDSSKYLSEDLCVIPKKKQSKKDTMMSAKASLIINDTTQTMLYSENIYKKRYPASITKILTALVTLKQVEQGMDLEEIVTISHEAANITEYGAKLCGFQEGDQIKLKDLLYSFLIYSGNDAGIAIAEHISGSVEEFAKLMNQQAKELGCSGSNFVNPHGLHDKKHYTTAYDLYLIFHELLNYNTFLDIINQPSYKAEYTDKDGNPIKKTFTTTDRYLINRANPPQGITVIGGKTGTTSAAGSNLILYSKDEQGNGYISIVLKADGGESLYSQMTHLLTKINQNE